MALEGDGVLGDAERLAGGDAELELDEVDALAALVGLHPHDLLGDRVLDLEAGVHLEEEELPGRVVEQELDRAGAGVAALLGEGDGRRRDRRALLLADRRGGRLLQHLLVAALRGAVALEEVQHRAVGVAHDLHLDVAAGLDVLLDQDRVVPERRPRLALRRGEGLVVVARAPHDAHPLAAAAGGRLDQHRVGEGGRVVLEGVRRHDRHPGRHRDVPGGVLAPHRVHHVGRRSDERDARLGQRPRERRALGQEAVAGVHVARTRLARSRDHGVDVEVGRHPHHPVRPAGVRGTGVEVGVDRDGPPPQALRRAHDPQGDLAAVGDQQRVHAVTSWKMPYGARGWGCTTSRRGPCPAPAGCRRGR